MGSFIEVKKSDGQFPLSVVYTPLSSFKKAIIRDIPEGALVSVQRFDPRVPYQIYLLLAGEHGEAPLMQNYLKLKFDELLKDWNLVQKKMQIQKAGVETQKRIQARGELSTIQHTMDIQSKIQKFQKPYIPIDKSRILKGGSLEEE